ncbi:SulP family inorganic anion transporter [Gryllotalpicola protaetiae]|uniref:SulP family inorganic anion transporter n=1 Tax=Gryllotalpicola protaetiae TaxID=2419771 RepID=A0A387BKZ4_9MICO|nr:SulP family inorganic anion transporter [Gryllotalpicola protaetiae]AYG04835.1 SulP family inorganic anion transporter [Gryllotalpicola protaetiae]
MALLAGTTRGDWRGEALMGITLAAMSAPVAMAFAQFAGLPPTMGLYTLIVPGIVFAFFAATGRLTAAPDAVGVALIAATLTPLAHPGTANYAELATAQALVAAAAYAVIAVFRLSRVTVLLPTPVLLGFSAAVALDLLVREIAGMFGIELAKTVTDAAADGFPQHARALITRLDTANVWAIAVAAGAMIVLLIGRRIARRLPWELAVYLAAFASYRVFELASHGVATVGRVGGGRPPFAIPLLDAGEWLALAPGAIVIAFAALALHQDQDTAYQPAGARDGIVYGLASAASGVSGGFAIGPSPAWRARLDELRSHSQLPALVAALLILAGVVFGGGFLGELPTPAFGAIAALATWPLLRLREARVLWRTSKGEFLLALVAFAVTLAFGPLWGLATAAAIGLLRLLLAASAPPLDVIDADGRPIAPLRAGAPAPRTTAPGIVIVRLAAPVNATTAGALARGIDLATRGADPSIRHLVVDGEAITAIDATGAAVLRRAFANLAERGVSVDYCRARAVLRVDLEHHGLLGGSHVFRTCREALDELGPR